MIQELYAALAPALPVAALLISLVSLMVSMRNREDQKQARLLEKKTELLARLAERQAKLGQLALVYIQKKSRLLASFGADRDHLELRRLDDALTLVLEEQLSAERWLSSVRRSPLPDLAGLEDMLATASTSLAQVTGSLVTEQGRLAELNDGA